jgi:hypothetical protein
VRWRVEDLYRDAEQGVRVADNLNTHTPAALYTVFAPESGATDRRTDRMA